MKYVTATDLNSWQYRYSTTLSNDYSTFTSYLHQAGAIAELMDSQQDGNATIFRTKVKPYAHISKSKHLREPFTCEQITITPKVHMQHLLKVALDMESAKISATCELDELKEELDDVVTQLDEYKFEISENKSLKKDLYEKVSIFGYSAKDVLNELFRDNGLAGGAK